MKMQIALCESEPMIENLIKEYLTPIGIKVIVPRRDGPCVDLFKSKIPDVIVLDTQMRNDAVEPVIRKIRDMGLTVPILLMGTNYGITSHEDAVAVGANAFIEKPFKLNNFLDQVLNLIPI